MHRDLLSSSAPSAKLPSLPQQPTPTDDPKPKLTLFPSLEDAAEEDDDDSHADTASAENIDILEKKKGIETIPYPDTV